MRERNRKRKREKETDVLYFSNKILNAEYTQIFIYLLG